MSIRCPWKSPTQEDVDDFTAKVRDLVGRLLPDPGVPWSAGRRQEALDLGEELFEDFAWDYFGENLLEHLIRLPSPYDLARAIAAAQGSTWPEEADALLLAVLNRASLTKQTYDLLTGPWRLLVAPLDPLDNDPEMNDQAREVGRLLLIAGCEDRVMSLDDLMVVAVCVCTQTRQ